MIFRDHRVLKPQEKAWLNNVITVFLQCRQFEKAQPLLLLLIQLFPQDARPLKQLAYLFYQQGHYDSGIEYCLRFERLDPDASDVRVHLLKSFCYLKNGQLEQARESYRQYSELRMMS